MPGVGRLWLLVLSARAFHALSLSIQLPLIDRWWKNS